jgi:hypothetical protein
MPGFVVDVSPAGTPRLSVIGALVLLRWDVVEDAVEAAVVELVAPFHRGVLDGSMVRNGPLLQVDGLVRSTIRPKAIRAELSTSKSGHLETSSPHTAPDRLRVVSVTTHQPLAPSSLLAFSIGHGPVSCN